MIHRFTFSYGISLQKKKRKHGGEKLFLSIHYFQDVGVKRTGERFGSRESWPSVWGSDNGVGAHNSSTRNQKKG